jgi:hypothetical protein
VIKAFPLLRPTVNNTGTLLENVRAESLKNETSVDGTMPKLAKFKMADLMASNEAVVAILPVFSFIPVSLARKEGRKREK